MDEEELKAAMEAAAVARRAWEPKIAHLTCERCKRELSFHLLAGTIVCPDRDCSCAARMRGECNCASFPLP